MPCDACEASNLRYRAAVNRLQSANAHLRVARLGTVQAAVARREVHDGLRALIAAEADLKAHKAWHIEALTTVPADSPRAVAV
jgi:hypothetical protein